MVPGMVPARFRDGALSPNHVVRPEILGKLWQLCAAGAITWVILCYIVLSCKHTETELECKACSCACLLHSYKKITQVIATIAQGGQKCEEE